jgi:cytochrome c-type biogenesis protein CcmI
MEVLIAVVLVAVLAAFVAWPLRSGPRDESEAEQPARSTDLADLEARKEALYRQIRDAELDREQGKLSRADWERLDAELRREAIAVLKLIDATGGGPL